MSRILFSAFIVYENPDDFPGEFAIREFTVYKGKPKPVEKEVIFSTGKTYDEVIATLPKGMELKRVPRTEGKDPPCLKEMWVGN